MRDLRGFRCGNVRGAQYCAEADHPEARFYTDPRLILRTCDPVLADLLERSLAGEHVDLRKHLTGG